MLALLSKLLPTPYATLAKFLAVAAVAVGLAGGGFYYGDKHRNLIDQAASVKLVESQNRAIAQAVAEQSAQSQKDFQLAMQAQQQQQNIDQKFSDLSTDLKKAIAARPNVFQNPNCKLGQSEIDLWNRMNAGQEGDPSPANSGETK